MHTVRTSLIRQNLHPDSEKLLNELINAFLFGAYTCKSMAYYFERDDIGMFGMADLNKWCAVHGFNDAKLVMDHITVRGGTVCFFDIKKPDRDDWGTPVDSLECLLTYKQTLYKLANKCHSSAHQFHDPHLNHFIETIILRPLVLFIRQCGILISNMKRVGNGLGEYQLNKDLKCYLEELKCALPLQPTSFSRLNRRFSNRRNVFEEESSSSSESSSEEEEEDEEEVVPNRFSVKNVIPVVDKIINDLE
ncbi:unnamed protein product [Brachionus calyciflorus]|uniref:Ferritin n=1 Tax=Brachionus calyciflorus TaxID=104777 RepID=A0A813MIG7_9BILA|nr:unnamed protein product [Brachionus calyciflorus]